ncbi:MAG TPA: glycosyltransferase [Myxococcales bacterium]
MRELFKRIAFQAAMAAAGPLRDARRRRNRREWARRRRVSAEPPNVVIEVGSLQSGGLEAVVRDLVLAFDRRRVRPIVACTDSAGPIAQQIEAAGIPVYVLGRSRNALAWLLEREEADLLNAHYSLFGGPVAARLGVPQVHVLHNSYLWLDDGGARRFTWAFRDVDRFVAVSSSVADYSRQRFGLSGVSVIPNGIDLASLRLDERAALRAETRRELGLEEAFVFLHAGRYEPRKAHPALIEAFARAAQRIPEAVLLFAGEAPDPAYLERCRSLASQSGVAHRIHLLPHRRDVERLFAAADAFVLPSTVEGSSISALQAAASGLPLVLTATGAARELFDRGAQGILVPSHLSDPANASPAELLRAEANAPEPVVDALANALFSVAQQPEKWRQRAADAAVRIRPGIGVEPMARQYERLFDDVVRSVQP